MRDTLALKTSRLPHRRHSLRIESEGRPALRNKFAAVAALAVSGKLVLSGCGGEAKDGASGTSSPPQTSSTRSATGDFNDADATFATDMIPHHRQAVEMAELAETRAVSPQVKALATKIKGAQGPEIQTMSDWLTSWGKPAPDDMTGMDMSGSMPGMMSLDDMTSLKGMSGSDFDQKFLKMMIEHHQGAIEMAKTEQRDGISADAIALARQIEQAQTREITTMQGLLD